MTNTEKNKKHVELTAPQKKESYGSRIMAGAGWNAVQLLAAQGTTFIVKLILARILLPEHFGIVGMAVVFTGLFNAIGDLGLAAALIQFKQDRLQKIHLDTAFWLSVLFNGTIFLILAFVIAPFAAQFYEEPILRQIIPVLGISVCLSPLSLIHRILLTRELRFKPLSIASTVSSIVAGVVAITLALSGAGVWSIVFQSVISAFILVPLLWFITKWRPHFRISLTAFKDIIGFSTYDLLSRVVSYITQNIDYFLIGKFLGAELLGAYTLAFMITNVVRSQIMSILNRIMFPIYSRLQDDRKSIGKYYLKVVQINTWAVTPIMLILLYFAKPIIFFVVGDKWGMAVFPVQAMAIASIIHTLGGTADSVFKGAGRIDLLFKLNLVKTFLITVPVFMIGIYYFGIQGAAVAVIFNKLAARFLVQHFIAKLVFVNEKQIIRAALPSFIAAIATLPVASFTYYALNVDTSVPALVSAILAVVVTYCLVIFFYAKSEIQQIARSLRLIK